MIVYYNWRLLKNLNISQILEKLNDEKYLKTINLKDSYIINPHKLLENSLRGSDTELYIYLDLASKRNIYDYKYMKKSTLKSYYATEYDVNKLHMNTLLEIKNDEIKFKYEE